MTQYVLMAYEILEEFLKSNDYQELKALNKKINILYQDEINTFQKCKKEFEEVQNLGGVYNKSYKEKALNLSKAKKELYEKEEIKTYFLLENKVQMELNEFTKKLTSVISNHIETPNSIGITSKKKGSCHVY